MHLFDDVPPSELARLATSLTRRRFLPGDDVIVEGVAPRCIYMLDSGSADVWRLDSKGAKQHLNRICAGATCGEMSLLTGKPASATVTAVTEVTATAISAPEFFDIAAQIPVIYRNIGTILADRLVLADRRVETSGLGALMWIVDHGAPPLLSYALACSIAWHTQTETAMLVADPERWQNLTPLGPTPDVTVSERQRVGASIHDRGPLAMNGGPAADASRRRGANVLVHLGAAELETVGHGKVIHVAPSGRTVASAIPTEAVVLRGWADSSSTPNRTESAAPFPTAADTGHLRLGMLPTRTRLGRAVGTVARELVGLRVGIALGEGGARGFAHLGVLRSLERAGISCDAIAGTSIGAAVAGLHAAGFSIDDSQAHLVEVGTATFRPALRRGSIMSHVGVERMMRKVWGEDTRIEDLSIPLATVTADIATGSEVVLKQGLLWAAVLASISIPGIYPPQRMGERLLVDGGVVNPVPIDAARTLGSDVVIAVRLAAGRRTVPVVEVEATKPSGRVPSAIHTIMRARDLMQSLNRFAVRAADVVIEPEFPEGTGLGLRDFSQGQRFVENGERAGESALSRIADLLPWLHQQQRT